MADGYTEMFSPARQGVMVATAAIEAAAAALADAEAAHALAVVTAAAADEHLRSVAEAEHAAGVDLATRIKQAVSGGEKLKVAPPSAKAAARGAAEADAAARAVYLLNAELEAARARLTEAQDGQRLATQAVLAEAVEGIVGEMEAAFALLERRFYDLRALESAGFTTTAAGGQRLAFNSRALRFLRWELQPSARAPSAQAALAEKWRAWRNRLVTDPMAQPPEGGE